MAAPRINPGDILGGKYRVERVLGAGGMGIVVAARHLELGQRVALKLMLKEAVTDTSQTERVLREARASVQLKSAHTARVLDVGKLPNGDPFIVMEYLEGRDLDEALKQHGPFPPHVACNYVLQAAEALAEAHGLGMIHRDVKLRNIFLTTTVDGRPLVKVLDFGLAKQTGIGGDVSLTATSSVFGSPQYMSPEQMRSAKDVDPRSDIWSLGVCLYELLTGRVPFDAAGVAEICAMVLKDPVPPPSQHIRGLPSDLEAVVLRCLEKDPSLRFQSIAELAFALDPYAAEEGSGRRILQVMEGARKQDFPTAIRTPPLAEEPRGKTMAAFSGAAPWMPSRPSWVFYAILGAVCGLMLTVGFGGILYATRRASPAPASLPQDAPPALPSTTETAIAEPVAVPPEIASAAPPVVMSAAPVADAPRPAAKSTPTSRPTLAAPRPVPTARTTSSQPAPKPAKATRTDPGDRP